MLPGHWVLWYLICLLARLKMMITLQVPTEDSFNWNPSKMHLSTFTANACPSHNSPNSKGLSLLLIMAVVATTPEAANRGECMGISVLASERASQLSPMRHCIPCSRTVSAIHTDPTFSHQNRAHDYCYLHDWGYWAPVEKGCFRDEEEEKRPAQEPLQSSIFVLNAKEWITYDFEEREQIPQ